MKNMRGLLHRTWIYLIAEPSTWVFRAFFQPISFYKFSNAQKSKELLTYNLRSIFPNTLISLVAVFIGLTLTNIFGFSFDFVSSLEGISVGIILGITFGISVGIGIGIGVGVGIGVGIGNIFGIIPNFVVGIAFGIAICVGLGIILGIIFGIVVSSVFGIGGGIIGGIMGTFGSGIICNIIFGVIGGIAMGIGLGISFIIFYTLGFFRIPLWPISAGSVWRAAYKSKQQPENSLVLLQKSALHWDEIIYLPLPGLMILFRQAAAHDLEETRQELFWVIAERPHKAAEARQVLLEIVAMEMQQRTTLRDIASASDRLSQLLPETDSALKESLEKTLRRLREVSSEARRYLNATKRRERQDSLDQIKTNLQTMQTSGGLSRDKLSQLLAGVANGWLTVVATEHSKFEAESDTQAEPLFNPYAPLRPIDKPMQSDEYLFVGRQDVRDFVEQYLATNGSNGGSDNQNRATLLLVGQRRMGKTTVLKQLPNLLGGRYLCVYLDGQNPAVSGGLLQFLLALVEEISVVMGRGGLRLPAFQLKAAWQTLLKNAASTDNPAEGLEITPSQAALHISQFDQWLKKVEEILTREERLLLLTFDEYEKLDEKFATGQLDLQLLDYFRNLIQHRPQLALLFSGIREFKELRQDWPYYMVNVRTKVISFLKPEEARLLITRPKPEFPGQEVYAEQAVVEEIIRQTGCHPFYVQALCSALVDHLNSQQGSQAQLSDIEPALEITFSEQCNPFIGMWRILSLEEQQLLAGLVSRQQPLADTTAISSISEAELLTAVTTTTATSNAQVALARLLRRELLRKDTLSAGYQFTSPMQAAWAKRGSLGEYNPQDQTYEL
jgi:hypothetical protein